MQYQICRVYFLVEVQPSKGLRNLLSRQVGILELPLSAQFLKIKYISMAPLPLAVVKSPGNSFLIADIFKHRE